MLMRGLKRRCPNCGQGKVFSSYFKSRESCEVCGYTFERDHGYWTGAMIVNIAACEAWFFLLFAGALIATLPDVEWIPILIIALITNGLLPIFFYPHSRTIWMSLDLHFHPLDEAEKKALRG
jgi:uncharacterized protein (DUF983 family)